MKKFKLAAGRLTATELVMNIVRKNRNFLSFKTLKKLKFLAAEKFTESLFKRGKKTKVANKINSRKLQ